MFIFINTFMYIYHKMYSIDIIKLSINLYFKLKNDKNC